MCPFSLICYMDHLIVYPYGKKTRIYFCRTCKRLIYTLHNLSVIKIYPLVCEKRKGIGKQVHWEVGTSFKNEFIIDPIMKRKIRVSVCDKCLGLDISQQLPESIWIDL